MAPTGSHWQAVLVNVDLRNSLWHSGFLQLRLQHNYELDSESDSPETESENLNCFVEIS